MPSASGTIATPSSQKAIGLALKGTIDKLLKLLPSGLDRQLQSLVGLPEQTLLDGAFRLAPSLRIDAAEAERLQKLRVLLEGIEAALVKSQNQSALDSARQRGRTIKHELVAKGELVSAAALADALGISRQAVHKAAKASRLFSLEAGGREHYFPAFQADPDVRAGGLEDVLAILRSESDWSKWVFFTTPSGSLGGITPVQGLSQGRKEAVLAAARAYIER
ncbi:hypothetical protein ACG33_04955 [Steroidobacter denitrificans]|uniref:Uncharacterized protein n=1 Tax=Steroidobacter denitrificans TaxID=465721 RepID=A0A127FA28_STEDE|nr:HTH domain-containing protein [Steroidobacter denitrificans]AMN46458.1 hypothetical protein ACG33_04955 [Steroidobacter denitrificans]